VRTGHRKNNLFFCGLFVSVGKFAANQRQEFPTLQNLFTSHALNSFTIFRKRSKHLTMKIINFTFILSFFFSLNFLFAASPFKKNFFQNQQDSIKINEDTLAIKKPPIIKYVKFDSLSDCNRNISPKISKSKMNKYLYEDIGDIIAALPGVFIYDLGSAGQSLFSTINGATKQQTTVFFDGRPLYDPQTGETDLNMAPVGFIKEAKFEQNFSEFNFANSDEILSLTSEQYEGNVPYSQIYHHKADLGYSDVDFIYGQRISQKMNILLGGHIKSFDGKDNAYSYEHQNLRGKLEYNYSNGWSFIYSMMNNRMERDNPGRWLGDNSYSTPNGRQKIFRDDFTLNILGNLLHKSWQNFRANIYYSSLNSKLIDSSIDLKRLNESRYGGFNFQMKQKMLGQLLTFGGNFEHSWISSGDVGKKKSSFGSVVIQDEWNRKDKFGLIGRAGLQFHEFFGSDFSGGLGSYLKISNNLRWILSARQTLRYPTFIEYYTELSENSGSNLKNEIIHKIETGFETNISTNFQMKTFFFLKNIQQLIRFQKIESTSGFFDNVGDIQFSGLDFSLDWRIGSKFQVNTFASLINNQDLYDFPNIQVTGNLQYSDRFFNDFLDAFFRLEGKYIGDRNSILLNPYSFSSASEKLLPVFVLNTTAIFDFGNLNFYLLFENMLNEDYQIIYGYPARNRTFHYGVRWEFWD